MRLTTKVIQKYNIPIGSTVGYTAYVTTEPMTLAVLCIGYSDGLRRYLSNGIGKVFFGNYSAKIIGVLSMDLMICDVKNIPDNLTEAGCDAWLLTNNYTINDIPYEILTSIDGESYIIRKHRLL